MRQTEREKILQAKFAHLNEEIQRLESKKSEIITNGNGHYDD